MITLSFFSYKGGSGRTSLIYNTIPFLVKKLGADNLHPIILMDLDLDSAGLTYLLANEVVKNPNTSKLSTNELISKKFSSEINSLKQKAKAAGSTTVDAWDLYKRMTPVGFQFGLTAKDYNANNTVLFIPASPKTSEGAGYDIDPTSSIKDFKQFAYSTGCSAIIFDLPAGHQVTGKQALQKSDAVLVCLRITKQHRDGTIDFLAGAARDCEFDQKYIIVPNAVPDCRKEILIDGEPFNYEAVKNMFVGTLNNIFESNGLVDGQLITDMFDGEWYGVPEVARFKIQEGIVYNMKQQQLQNGEQLLEDEELAYKAYDKLTDIIIRCKN